MFCRRCGVQLSDDSTSCYKCGTAVVTSIENKSKECICPVCGGDLTIDKGYVICLKKCGYKYSLTFKDRLKIYAELFVIICVYVVVMYLLGILEL